MTCITIAASVREHTQANQEYKLVYTIYSEDTVIIPSNRSPYVFDESNNFPDSHNGLPRVHCRIQYIHTANTRAFRKYMNKDADIQAPYIQGGIYGPHSTKNTE